MKPPIKTPAGAKSRAVSPTTFAPPTPKVSRQKRGKVLTAAEKAGTEWLIVEQDNCPGDPFDSIKISYDYLSGLLGK